MGNKCHLRGGRDGPSRSSGRFANEDRVRRTSDSWFAAIDASSSSLTDDGWMLPPSRNRVNIATLLGPPSEGSRPLRVLGPGRVVHKAELAVVLRAALRHVNNAVGAWGNIELLSDYGVTRKAWDFVNSTGFAIVVLVGAVVWLSNVIRTAAVPSAFSATVKAEVIRPLKVAPKRGNGDSRFQLHNSVLSECTSRVTPAGRPAPGGPVVSPNT